jgi:hypothetical protein
VAWKDMLRSIPTIELSEGAEDTTGISRVGGTGHQNSCCPVGIAPTIRMDRGSYEVAENGRLRVVSYYFGCT